MFLYSFILLQWKQWKLRLLLLLSSMPIKHRPAKDLWTCLWEKNCNKVVKFNNIGYLTSSTRGSIFFCLKSHYVWNQLWNKFEYLWVKIYVMFSLGFGKKWDLWLELPWCLGKEWGFASQSCRIRVSFDNGGGGCWNSGKNWC